MAATLKSQLEVAQAAAQLWEGRARSIRNEYDVLRTNKLRRQPVRETTDEIGIYTPHKRALGTNVGRDIERNYAPARSIINQFRQCVVGALGKIQVNVPGGEEAASYFNEVWAKDCDYRDELHWSTVLQNIVAASLREGDMLAIFDDRVTEDDSGKLLTWEADQIVPMDEKVAKTKGYAPPEYVQDGGIIRNKWGRVVGYVTTGKRGLTMISDAADATVWKRDQARMPRSPWRLNQGRSVPAMLTAAASILDVYEMFMRELQTAKKAASDYANVYRSDAVDDWDNPGTMPEVLPENDGKSAASVDAEGANSATDPAARNYENLEAYTGGYMDYMSDKDRVEFAKSDRPNVHMAEFIEAAHCQAGSAFGLARAYTLLRADSSYTSFRGDMLLSWNGAFYPTQKWLERSIADWVGQRVLNWAMRKGKIKELPAGWDRRLAWLWPKMPEVDELDAANAVAQSLKNGTTDFSQLLGPDWRKKLESFAQQLEVIRALNIPAGVLELKSGGQANPKKDGQPQPTTTGDK